MLKSTIDKATGFEKRFENIGTQKDCMQNW